MTSEDVRVIRNGGCLGIVRMYGEYDIASKEQFQGALEPLYDCESVMIDMKDVDYIDSTVLSCLIRLNNEMQKRHGEAHVEVCNASSNIRRIFEMCGLDRLFGVS